jgi:glycosyltransferase involved in cell wall biosynthesis
MSSKKPHILHLHSSFAPGGKELRSVQLINAFGTKLQHSIVSAVPEQLGAAERIKPSIKVAVQPDFPSLQGKPTPGRLQKIAHAMKGYDLILTYNWGAMDGVMAHTVFSEALGLARLIHHEDGFDEQELVKRKRRRTWFRRIALGRASGLVVPSEVLEGIALTEWAQPIGRVKRIANGIDTARFVAKPKPDSLPRLVKRPGELWVGTLAGLRVVKNLPRLVRSFATLSRNWQLVIFGDGPARDDILAEASRLEVDHRVHLPGVIDDPAKVAGLFDIFALSSDSEQFPISVVEAMAAGLPVAAPNVGDIADMLAEENTQFLTPYFGAKTGPRGEPWDNLEGMLAALSKDEQLRKTIGEANRRKARAEFDQKAMIDSYRRLYSSAMGHDRF